MKISVIIPTYKPAEYIWECLNSLENQTFPKAEFEVILVLNGCKEPYYSAITDYIAGSNVPYDFIQTDQGGVSNARNIALDNAKGEYITFIDDDDYVSPSYLEELYNIASPDTIALCYPYAFKDGDITQLPYRITTQYDNCVKRGKQQFTRARKFFSGPCMKLIHRNIIDDRRFDKRFKNGEDSLFMFLISDKFKFVDFTSKDAVYFRRIRNSSANFKSRSIMQKVKNSLLMIFQYIKMYATNPFNYRFDFLFTRVLGAVKSMLCN